MDREIINSQDLKALQEELKNVVESHGFTTILKSIEEDLNEFRNLPESLLIETVLNQRQNSPENLFTVHHSTLIRDQLQVEIDRSKKKLELNNNLITKIDEFIEKWESQEDEIKKRLENSKKIMQEHKETLPKLSEDISRAISIMEMILRIMQTPAEIH